MNDVMIGVAMDVLEGARRWRPGLEAEPLAPLLDRLFEESDASHAALDALLAQTPPDEQRRLLRSREAYAELYHRLRDFALPVSRETGRLLYMLARQLGAARGAQACVVEFGTSFGISTLHLAAGLRDGAALADRADSGSLLAGRGRVITTEFEAAKAARARAHLHEAGLLPWVELREGDALQTLARDLPPRIDLVLLDGAKALYPEILALVQPRLAPGALVLADNADHCPAYLARVRDASSGYLSLPVGGDVELSQWQGAAA